MIDDIKAMDFGNIIQDRFCYATQVNQGASYHGGQRKLPVLSKGSLHILARCSCMQADPLAALDDSGLFPRPFVL